MLRPEEMDSIAAEFVRDTTCGEYTTQGSLVIADPAGCCYWLRRIAGPLTGMQPGPVFVSAADGTVATVDIPTGVMRAFNLSGLDEIDRHSELKQAMQRPDRTDPRQVRTWSAIVKAALAANDLHSD